MTSVLPQTLYSPEKYAGEPEQIWRLFVDGKVELIVELQPFVPAAGVAFSPNLQYFFYLNNSCVDGMGKLYVYDLASAENYPILCVWKLPEWFPDNEHFIYESDGLWQLSSISDRSNQSLDILNASGDPSVHASPNLTWINNEYFLLFLQSSKECTLHLATLQGVVMEIAGSSPDVCPWMVDFHFRK